MKYCSGKSPEKSKRSKSGPREKRDKSKTGIQVESKNNSIPRITSVLPIPNVLTCEIGFGLKHIKDPITSLPTDMSDVKMKHKFTKMKSYENIMKSASTKKPTT